MLLSSEFQTAGAAAQNSREEKTVFTIWKAVVEVPCNLQRVVLNLQRVVDINQ